MQSIVELEMLLLTTKLLTPSARDVGRLLVTCYLSALLIHTASFKDAQRQTGSSHFAFDLEVSLLSSRRALCTHERVSKHEGTV